MLFVEFADLQACHWKVMFAVAAILCQSPHAGTCSTDCNDGAVSPADKSRLHSLLSSIIAVCSILDRVHYAGRRQLLQLTATSAHAQVKRGTKEGNRIEALRQCMACCAAPQ